MPRELSAIDLDNLIDRYSAGESLYKLTTVFRISDQRIRQILTERGVPIRNPAQSRLTRRIPLDSEDILRRYRTGETKKAIAKSLGVNQVTVQGRLADFGIKTAPNRSESMKTRLARMTPEERLELSQAAHDAVRGMKHSWEQLITRAIAKQSGAKHGSESEALLASWLAERGIAIVPQQAIGPYNTDLGAFPVAVEVFGGNWHASGRHAARLPERTRYILNQGWNLVIVWVNALHHPLLPEVADDIVTFHKQSRGNPAFRGQYRVVWGDGQFYSSGSLDDDEFTLIPSGKRGQWSRTRD